MSHLAISLLGSYQILLDGTPVSAIETQKGWALLAYLAVEADRAHSRSALAALLWPDRPERAARRNLSQALYNLRQALETGSDSAPFFLVTQRDIQFNLGSDHRLDVATFRALLDACRSHPHRSLEVCTLCLDRLRQAVEMYNGDFLTGFCLPGSDAFDEWCLIKQEALHQQVMEALTRLAAIHERRRSYTQAADFLRHLIALEPWREEAHRQLMVVLARTGQRAVALAQYERCRQILHDEFDVEPGEETRTILAAIQDGKLDVPEADASLFQPRAHNLPAPTTPFFGRKAELTQLVDLIRDPNYRFITLVGAGGVGKTRLALQTAERARVDFSHGTWFVPLAGLPAGSPEQIEGGLIAAQANALGFAFSGPRDPKEQVFAYLGARQSLLVLDNFEHLIEGAGLVIKLLEQAPGVAVLCTSREPLHCQAEYVLAVEGLPVPPPDGKGETGAALPVSDSVQLFVERANRSPQRFVLSAENAAQVAKICRLVTGNPLGLELAAAKVHRQALPEVVRAIQTNLDFLATRMRDVPARHRSMRAVFEASWQSLSPREQQALAQLSVFRGGFMPEAAQAVAGAADDDLRSLCDKSLLGGSASGRYELHELVRQYAAEKLASGSGMLDARDRHSAYFLQFIVDQETAIRGPEPRSAVVVLQCDLDNVQQAWQQALSELQVDHIYRSVPGLARYYQLSSLFVQGAELLGQAANALRATLHAAPMPDPEVSRALCRVLNRQGLLLRFGEKHERMRQCAEEAVLLARQVPDLYEEAYSHWLLAVSIKHHGSLRTAERHTQQALALSRAGRFRRLEAKNLSLLADVQMGLGSWTQQERISHHQQALAILEELGDVFWQAEVLNFLAGTHYRQHSYVQALAYWREALARFQQLGNRSSQKRVLFNVGAVHSMLGRHEKAQVSYERSWKIARDLGVDHLPLPLIGLCRAHTLQGHHDEAAEYGERAVQLSRQLGNTLLETEALLSLARTLAAQGSMDQARSLYQKALALANGNGDRFLAAEALAGLAHTTLEQGKLTEASQWIEPLLQMESECALAGCEEWAICYLICFRVLQALDTPNAKGILSKAHAHIEAVVAQIEDAALRRSFLENVAANREIVAEWDRIHANDEIGGCPPQGIDNQ